ncbi:MAG: HAD family hydrolase [Mycolicibacterium sp.]|nr:HAD family hydrolase [Mycolicibacterium sp.]
MANSRPAVLFDIDGTLVDSNYLHVHAWQRAFAEVGLPVQAWHIHRSIGMDGSILVDELSRGAPGDVQKRLKDLHTRYYQAGAALLRSTLDCDDVVSAITSSADVEQAKPNPGIVEVALAKAGVSARRAIFVGDAVWDVEASGRAGVPCIAVLSGGVSRCELEEAGAAAVFDDPEDLREHLGDTAITTLR